MGGGQIYEMVRYGSGGPGLEYGWWCMEINISAHESRSRMPFRLVVDAKDSQYGLTASMVC